MSRSVATATKPVVDLSALVTGLPQVPDASLDPFLDAASRSFALYGIAHSSVPDIARQMGVSRATVYRRIGTVESAIRLLLARELNRILNEAASRLAGGRAGPAEIIDVLVWISEYARDHEVLRRVLKSDAEMLGPFLTENFSELVTRASESVRPVLGAAMASGQIARRDPAMLADWLSRLVISIGLAPPAAELREFFNQMVRPVLDPSVQKLKAK